MDGGLNSVLQSIGPLLATLMIAAALIMLWRQSRSIWLIVALVAELVSLVFRGVIAIAPDFARSAPLFFTVWLLCSLIFAAGLLGYAIETTQKPAK
jgi:uncharacterized membrane protein YoaK (UPF0700 family)